MSDSRIRAARHALPLARALRAQQTICIELRSGASVTGWVERFDEQDGVVRAVTIHAAAHHASPVLSIPLDEIARVDEVDRDDSSTGSPVADAALRDNERPTARPPASTDATIRVRAVRFDS